MRRLAFSTLGCSGATLDEVIALATRHRCQGVELRSAPDEFLSIDISEAERARIQRRLADAGLTVLSVTSYVGLCAESTDDLVPYLELARSIGAGGVRVFMKDPEPASPDGLTRGEERALERLAQVPKNLRVQIETHDTHSLGSRMSKFMTVADTLEQSCGVIWDTAHSWTHGESPGRTFDMLRPWLDHLQVKDVRSAADPKPVMIGEGTYPIRELSEVVAGWDGWFSLEWERKWHPDLPDISTALRALPDWL